MMTDHVLAQRRQCLHEDHKVKFSWKDVNFDGYNRYYVQKNFDTLLSKITETGQNIFSSCLMSPVNLYYYRLNSQVQSVSRLHYSYYIN